jgi:probable HAF family extracellular repeat protein
MQTSSFQGAINTLPTLGGINGNAMDVNASGQVVGIAETDEPTTPCIFPFLFHFGAVFWDHGQPIRLPGIGDDTDGIATTVNDKGEALGATFNCTAGRSVLWQHLKPLDITHSTATGDLELSAGGLNNRTQVAGTAFDASGSTAIAYVWQDGEAKLIGTLPNHIDSHGNWINNRGQIVGQSCFPDGFPDCSVFLWQQGSMKDLNDLVPSGSISMVDVGKINDSGQVVGLAITNEGEFHAFLATPSNDREGEEPAPGSVANRPKPVITIPEVARRALEHRMLLRSHLLLLGPPRNKAH